jgi:pyridoxine kinase
MARVLALSSHVVRGHVGLAATVPALQWLGHEVWALPTVVLASRPGLGRLERQERQELPDLAAMLAALEADGCWPMLDAVLTGYFPSAASVDVAADAIARIRAANPRAKVLVDPILGDAGRLYVAPTTAAAIRDRLLPLADIATPNLFELTWLTGAAPASLDDAASDRALENVARLARQLGPATVVVTSAGETAAEVATLLVTGSPRRERRLPRRDGIPNGAGDLFAGLLLGYLLDGLSEEAALDASLAALDRVLAASAGRDVLELGALADGAG